MNIVASQGLIHGGDYSFVSLKVRKIRKEVSAMALRFWLSVLARYALCGVARARELANCFVNGPHVVDDAFDAGFC
jgi:hypothetical protein